jgi:hypothetical protein
MNFYVLVAIGIVALLVLVWSIAYRIGKVVAFALIESHLIAFERCPCEKARDVIAYEYEVLHGRIREAERRHHLGGETKEKLGSGRL